MFRLCENKAGFNFAPVFSALLGSIDEAAKGLVVRRLSASVPSETAKQRAWFDIYLPHQIDGGKRRHYESLAQNLKRTLVFSNGVSVLGMLRSCLDYALNDNTKLSGVFEAVKAKFKVAGGRNLLDTVTRVNDFRNNRVAHQEQPLTDAKLTRPNWPSGLTHFVRSLPPKRWRRTTGESLLTLAGYYVGREFRFAGVRGLDGQPGQIKFYGDDGEVLRDWAVDEQRHVKAA